MVSSNTLLRQDFEFKSMLSLRSNTQRVIFATFAIICVILFYSFFSPSKSSTLVSLGEGYQSDRNLRIANDVFNETLGVRAAPPPAFEVVARV